MLFLTDFSWKEPPENWTMWYTQSHELIMTLIILNIIPKGDYMVSGSIGLTFWAKTLNFELWCLLVLFHPPREVVKKKNLWGSKTSKSPSISESMYDQSWDAPAASWWWKNGRIRTIVKITMYSLVSSTQAMTILCLSYILVLIYI